MRRVSSPQGRKRVRSVIGRSNRRQLLNPLDGSFEAPRSIPTPGLDGTLFDGDVDTFMRDNAARNITTAVGPDGMPLESTPQFPTRCNTAMSMLNTTIGYPSLCALKEEEVSWQWGNSGLKGGYFEDTLGPDGGPRRSHSSMSTRGPGRSTAWRRTEVSSASVTLSPDPEHTKQRLTAATRTQRLRDVPTATELLSTLSAQKNRSLGDRSGGLMVKQQGPVTGLSGVTPGPMVFDDPKYLQCPTLPNRKMAGAISKQLNAATDDTQQSVPSESTAGNGICANGAWVMRKPPQGQYSPNRAGGALDGGGSAVRTRMQLSPAQSHENPHDVLNRVPLAVVAAHSGRVFPQKSSNHVVQPSQPGAFFCSQEQYNSTNRGLGASLDAQESKLQSLATQQRRAEKKAESHRRANSRAQQREELQAIAKSTYVQRKGELQAAHESQSKMTCFKVPPPNSFAALMDP